MRNTVVPSHSESIIFRNDFQPIRFAARGGRFIAAKYRANNSSAPDRPSKGKRRFIDGGEDSSAKNSPRTPTEKIFEGKKNTEQTSPARTVNSSSCLTKTPYLEDGDDFTGFGSVQANAELATAITAAKTKSQPTPNRAQMKPPAGAIKIEIR